MLINPQKSIDEGIIVIPDYIEDVSKYIQPNAVDFTLDAAFKPNISDVFSISENVRNHAGFVPVDPVKLDVPGEDYATEWIVIPARGMIDVFSNFRVSASEDIAIKLIIRSSLSRNGLMLSSGLFDSGFNGNVGCTLHNLRDVPARIAVGTRIGQILVMPAGSAHLYDGQYNNQDEQTNWTETDVAKPTKKPRVKKAGAKAEAKAEAEVVKVEEQSAE